MTTTEPAEDLQALRRRVRTMQHARSFPLLVLGALFINYGVTSFSNSPVQWRYGAPLAFVLVWALLKVNESTIGVGTGRVDYLAAAFVVFGLINLTYLQGSNGVIPGLQAAPSPYLFEHLDAVGLQGVWVAIVGLAFLFIAVSARDMLLMLLAGVTVVSGALMAVGHNHTVYFDSEKTLSLYYPQNLVVVGLGALLAVVGLVAYWTERRAVR